MLRLLRRDEAAFLTQEELASLRRRQSSATDLSTQGELSAAGRGRKIRERWDAFRAGRTSTGVFDSLWRELLEMSFDRCAFCETSGPNTVEHLREKARHPAEAFEWNNLLPACGVCNLYRQNSLIDASPIDPTEVEPLDLFGWDQFGSFAARPENQREVELHVEMYGLKRFAHNRAKQVRLLRALVLCAATENPVPQATLDALESLLSAKAERLGPIREYLLRPPDEDDALVLDAALERVPVIREWVEPWIRPPAWAAPRWT